MVGSRLLRQFSVAVTLVAVGAAACGPEDRDLKGNSDGGAGTSGGIVPANHPCNPDTDKCPAGYECTSKSVGTANTCHKTCSVNGALCGSDGQVCLLNFEGKLFCSAGCSLSNPEAVCGPGANCDGACDVGGAVVCSDCSGAGSGAGYCSDATDCLPGYGCTPQYGCLRWCRIGKNDCAGCTEPATKKVQIGADTYGFCPP